MHSSSTFKRRVFLIFAKVENRSFCLYAIKCSFLLSSLQYKIRITKRNHRWWSLRYDVIGRGGGVTSLCLVVLHVMLLMVSPLELDIETA